MQYSKVSLSLLATLIVTACATVTSNQACPIPQEYSKEEQKSLVRELDDKCPITIDEYGNEQHTCVMIDRIVSDYRLLRNKLKN